MTPRAVLFDLDDTLISAYRQPELAWQDIAAEFAVDLGALAPSVVADAVSAASVVFWSDADRHRRGRLDLLDARRDIVLDGFSALARDGHAVPDGSVARRMAVRYQTYRDEQMHLFPHAHEVVDTLRDAGVKLALITNGAAQPQRAKVVRFDLTHRFHHIQIEGEHGFGKPEDRAYLHAMSVLGVEPHDRIEFRAQLQVGRYLLDLLIVRARSVAEDGSGQDGRTDKHQQRQKPGASIVEHGRSSLLLQLRPRSQAVTTRRCDPVHA